MMMQHSYPLSLSACGSHLQRSPTSVKGERKHILCPANRGKRDASAAHCALKQDRAGVRVQQAIVLCILYDCLISQRSTKFEDLLLCLLMTRCLLLSATRSLTEPPGFRNYPGQYGSIGSHIAPMSAYFAFALLISSCPLHMHGLI